MWKFLKSLFGFNSKIATGFVSVKLTSELFTHHPEATLHGHISIIKKDGYAEGIIGLYGELAKDVRNKIYDLGSIPLDETYAIDFTNLFILEPIVPNGPPDETKVLVTDAYIKRIEGVEDNKNLTTSSKPGMFARTNWFELLGDIHTAWEIVQG